MRRVAKIVNFGLLYGMGPFRLAGDLKIPQKDARQIIDDYFNAFPGIRDFLSKTVEQTRQTGFSTTLFGRRRGIADINSPNHQLRTAAERMALNMPVQGTAADIIKIAMVNLDRRLKRDGYEIVPVHDELFWKSIMTSPAQGDLISEMENAAALAVPLVAENLVGTGEPKRNRAGALRQSPISADVFRKAQSVKHARWHSSRNRRFDTARRSAQFIAERVVKASAIDRGDDRLCRVVQSLKTGRKCVRGQDGISRQDRLSGQRLVRVRGRI